MDYLTTEQVLFIHARLIEETGGGHGILDLGLLLSAIARPQASFDVKDLYPDIFSKAAALMDSLVRNHPFMDGNKRTGISAASLFLSRNDYRVIASNDELRDFTFAVAQSKLLFADMVAWLQEKSVYTG
jgi:death-on-curing protein